MTVAQPGRRESAAQDTETRRKGRMEQVIEAAANGLGGSITWMVDHWVLFGVFALLWVGFGAGLLISQGTLHDAWLTIRGLPLVVQLIVWLLFLPVMAGLWVWETTWPLVVRLVLVLGLAGWNLLVFIPRAAQSVKP